MSRSRVMKRNCYFSFSEANHVGLDIQGRAKVERRIDLNQR